MSGSVLHVWKPSCARRVTLDGFLPVPRGTVPSAPLPLAWPAKDPGDVLDYEIDASEALLGNENDEIVSVGVAIVPSGTLTQGQIAVDGAIVAIWLSGGLSGTIYLVEVTMTTASGRVIARAVQLPVESLLAPVLPSSTGTPGLPATALTTDAGVVVTDQNGAPILVSV